LGIVCHAFFDDFRIIDFACEQESSAKWFDHLVRLLGWKFDIAKNQTGLYTLPMLGNLERYADIGYSESLMVEAKTRKDQGIRGPAGYSHSKMHVARLALLPAYVVGHSIYL
jgi:hypothetical protein